MEAGSIASSELMAAQTSLVEPPRNFFAFSRTELTTLLTEELGESAFRATQLFDWAYRKLTFDTSLMTNIGKELRARFGEFFTFPLPTIRSRQISKDGTRKYLFEVGKGDLVESVMIKQPDRMTLCVSSQVGCAMGCGFCRTATMGLRRHLTTAEIIQQVMGVIVDAKEFGDMFTNIVFMGMGEPLHNYDNLKRALEILHDVRGLGIGPRRVTISTSGLLPALKRFGAEGMKANIAISLNATTDATRSEVMPINRRYPLAELIEAIREYPLDSRKRITVEYVMLHGFNDTPDDLKRLITLMHKLPVKVNLIPYNANAGLGFEAPPHDLPIRWQKSLNAAGLIATIRWSKGADISAACGQLVTESAQKRRQPLAA